MKHLLITLSIALVLPIFAQKKPGKGEKFFYKDATIETSDYKIYIVDAVALPAYSKFKLKIFNKTNDYLFIKPAEIVMLANGKNIENKEKSFVIAPNDEGSKVIDFKGAEMQFQNYDLKIKGIYKAAAKGKIIEIPNFDLPPTKNEFEVGSFSCILKKHDANTDRSISKFECKYSGDDIGIINPNKTACIMPNGKDNATAKRETATLLEKGGSETFVLQYNEIAGAGDLQKKSIAVKWNDAFQETKLKTLSGSDIKIEYDSVKSEEKK